MKWLITYLFACSAMLISNLAIAEDSPHEFSANIALTTDYMYRGLSQSDEQPAVSAGFDYTHYVVGLNKSLSIFDFDVSYYDTSDKTDCGGDACEAVVFTVSSSF